VVCEYLDSLLVAGLFALLLITFVIRTYYIPSVSMVPTLNVRDVVLVDELTYRFGGPQPQDVAVFAPPINSEGSAFIKRVIGVPGDTIRISDGIVYRNGTALVEPYANEPAKYDLEIQRYQIYVDGRPLDPLAADVPPKALWQAPDRIPNGFYLMLGDNRNYSDDSHVWGFTQASGTFVAGPLAKSEARAGFAGKAFLLFWPLDRTRILH
jgi:signal peptidase I